MDLDKLREALDYNPDTGLFVWKRASGTHINRLRGKIAGMHSGGYIHIRCFKKSVLAHRLAWFYVHGKWPSGQIDHINGDRLDNRIANLRDIPPVINSQNMRKPMRNNKTGYLGVSLHRCGRYVSYIRINGRKTYVGLFNTPEEASAAYIEAKRKVHAGCTL